MSDFYEYTVVHKDGKFIIARYDENDTIRDFKFFDNEAEMLRELMHGISMEPRFITEEHE